MSQTQDRARRADELRRFETCRTIDVFDEQAMRFWAHRLGVAQEEIAEAVRLVGPNSTAVALKLEAPRETRTAPPEVREG